MSVSSQEMELLARQINQAHRAAIQTELNHAGLNEVGHPMLLSILKSGEDSPEERCFAQRELAEFLHISPAAVANSLKSLEKGGYIRREPGQADARRNRVLLTEKGRQAVDGCEQAIVTVSQRMLIGFSEEERQQLLSFRKRMLRNLLEAASEPHQAKED
ncbi:MAG: MarR family transcriptional regulator [Clostridium sp.]|nr:MarR family transcriptional regulator [Clostridium sp.]